MTKNKEIAISLVIFIFIIGEFFSNAITINSLMTYTVRTKKLLIHPNITGNTTVDQYKNNYYINGNIVFNFKKSPNNVIMIFHRCNPEGINCEYFQTWKLSDFCSKIKEKNQIWSSFISSIYPPYECPIKENYQIRNATFEVGPGIRWYADVTKYQWIIEGKMYYDNLYMGGYTLYLSIFGYRKRIKSTLFP